MYKVCEESETRRWRGKKHRIGDGFFLYQVASFLVVFWLDYFRVVGGMNGILKIRARGSSL